VFVPPGSAELIRTPSSLMCRPVSVAIAASIAARSAFRR
jgi:hypothetical protein